MGSEASPHMFFFPFMAAGHMNPMLDMARIFARRGARATVLATPSNAALARSAIRCDDDAGHALSLIVLPLPPPSDTGLPDGWDASSSFALHDFQHLQRAAALLRPPLRHFLAEYRPDCLVSDMFLPWTADVAEEVSVPRIVFHGMCLFSLCVLDHLKRYRPHDGVSDDDEPFVVPGLPGTVKMTRSQLPEPIRARTEFNVLMEEMSKSEARSYGVVVNSFREMEPGYVEHFREVIGKKAWQVGPVSLCRGTLDIVDRGECLAWLDSVDRPGSVLYVCFGSLSRFSAAQLREIAVGLEASGERFVWVVRGDHPSDWTPEGWNTAGRGLVIRGWAPQILILNHEAVGGFLTHCGWNSVLEGASAGMPMVTWPMFGDQFFNEMLVVEVLGIGVRVGRAAGRETRGGGGEEEAVVRAEEIEKAVRGLMGGGEEAEGRRRTAKRVGEMAAAAVEEGGSSYEEMGRLMEELIDVRKQVSVRPSALSKVDQDYGR